MTQAPIGHIHSTENFGTVDGPGIRYVIFVQGCRMRCKFCHNPDTWKMSGGKDYTADELLEMAERYRPYWDEMGGITVSGGEPLLQIPFVTDLFKKAKERGINTCLDTSGQGFSRDPKYLEQFNELMNYTDLVMLDIKLIEPHLHKKLTKLDNEPILDMAKYLNEIHQPMWIRHVLLPGWSDKDEYLDALHDFLTPLTNIEKVEVLPYHTMGKFKWDEMGLHYELEGVEPPTADRVKNAKERLHVEDYPRKK